MWSSVVALLLQLNLLFVIGQDDTEHKLIDAILTGYSAKARPVKNRNDVVNVTMSLYLTKVVNLNADTHVLTTSGWVQAIWNDPRLAWDPAQHGGIERTSLYSADVWFPDFALENSAGSYYELSHTRSFKIGIDHTGRMEWEPGGKFETYCHVDVFFYPFDTQTCDMVFTEWGHDSSEVALKLGSDVIYNDEGFYQKSGAWQVITGSARSEEHQYESKEKFSRIIFTISLNRVYMYYFVTMLFPALVLSCLVLLVYGVPRDRGEKLSMGLTLMLAFFVFMLNMSSFVPRSAQVIPLIQIYLLFYMATTTGTVGLSVMLLWLNSSKNIHPPQRWLRFLVYRVMANVICYGCCSKKPRFEYFGNKADDEEITANGTEKKGKSQEEATLAASNLVELNKLTSDADAIKEGLETQPASTSRGMLDSVARIKKRLKNIEKGTVEMMNVIWRNDKDNVTQEELDKIRAEWMEITGIINKFCFWLLFSFTIAFIIMCALLWIRRT